MGSSQRRGETTRRTSGARSEGRAKDVVERVLHATALELSEHGYAALRVEDVAARSGVNKTTIYRRWPTRIGLVSAALASVIETPTLPDTGDVRADLRESLLDSLRLAKEPMGRALLRLMQSERSNPDVDALTRLVREAQRSARVKLVERAQQRGQLPETTPAQLVVELVSAPVLSRAVTFGEVVDEAYVDAVLDVVLAGVRALPTGRS